MTLAELINQINDNRKKLGLKNISINTRTSSSGSGRTIEIKCGEEVIGKSINGGAINWFLKGMMNAFKDGAVPKFNFNQEFSSYGEYTRAIE